MAAGIGSRYGGLKQLDSFGPNGETLIDYSLFDAVRAGFGKAVFVIRPETESLFRERILTKVADRIETALVFQTLEELPAKISVPAGREKPWGTAHAVMICRSEIDRPFAVINADDFYGPSSFRILADHLNRPSVINGSGEYAMVGFRLKNTLSSFGTVSRGFCRISPEGYLQDIRERLRIKEENGKIIDLDGRNGREEVDPESIVSTNIWGFTPDLFSRLEDNFPAFLKKNIGDPKAEYLLPEEAGRLIRQKKARVRVYPSREKWLGVTYPEDRAGLVKDLADLIARGLYPEKLWSDH